MPVDSFKFLPRLIAEFYRLTDHQAEYPIPWTPISKPLNQCRFALVTSGGLYHRKTEPPFDLERERQEPTWGDPSFRTIPINIRQSDLGVSHLHYNSQAVLKDVNVLLPIDRFKELVKASVIGDLASEAYSFMGYQGFPPNTTYWQELYAPQVVEKLKAQDVDCVLLTPA